MNNEKELVRVTVYLEKSDYRKLRAKMALMGVSVSRWLRGVVKDVTRDV